MEPLRQTSSGERHSLVPNGTAPGSRRASLAVPLLDEESLKANNNHNNNGSSAAAGGFTLVSQHDEMFKTTGHGVDTTAPSPNSLSKNFDQGQIYTMMQQQQAVAMAAAQLEQAYHQTCYLLQQCSPNALLTVLMSLLNDYPTTLVQPIRARVEQVLAQQMSPSANSRPATSARKPGSSFVPNSGAAPWTPSNVHGSAAPTPTANSTPGGHRRGRGHKGREEEQEMCSIHNNMRAMKHLQLNQSTGLYECVHGFHCLVDGPADVSPKRNAGAAAAAAAAATSSQSNSVSRGSNPPPSGDSQPFVPAAFQQQQQQPIKSETRFSATEVEALRLLGYTFGTNNAASANANSAMGSSSSMGVTSPPPPLPRRDMVLHHRHSDPEADAADTMLSRSGVSGGVGGGYTVVGGDHHVSAGTSPLDGRLNMDLPSLEYLLQSVRDIDDD